MKAARFQNLPGQAKQGMRTLETFQKAQAGKNGTSRLPSRGNSVPAGHGRATAAEKKSQEGSPHWCTELEWPPHALALPGLPFCWRKRTVAPRCGNSAVMAWGHSTEHGAYPSSGSAVAQKSKT